MFDSENLSLVTRLEATNGLTLDYSTNSENENLWSLSVDSEYLQTLYNNTTTAVLSTVDEARITQLETLLGIGVVDSETTVAVDSDNIHTITYGLFPGRTTDTSKYIFRILANGNVSEAKTINVSTNSDLAGIHRSLTSQVKGDTALSKFFSKFAYDATNNNIEFRWGTKYTAHDVTVTIVTTNPTDLLTVTVA